MKGLNWNSSQRRDKGKLWPSCCQTLLWAGQDRGWRSISDLQEGTLCPRLWLLFPSPIAVLCCRVELPDGHPEHRHILNAKTWIWLWQGPFFSIFTMWLSLAPSSVGSWGLQNCQFAAWRAGLCAHSGFLPSALWQRIAALKIESLSLIELCRVLQEAWNQTSAPRAFVSELWPQTHLFCKDNFKIPCCFLSTSGKPLYNWQYLLRRDLG